MKDRHVLVKGRAGIIVPWIGEKNSEPWRSSYLRVALKYTDSESKSASGSKRYHEQIVHKRNVQYVKPFFGSNGILRFQ